MSRPVPQPASSTVASPPGSRRSMVRRPHSRCGNGCASYRVASHSLGISTAFSIYETRVLLCDHQFRLRGRRRPPGSTHRDDPVDDADAVVLSTGPHPPELSTDRTAVATIVGIRWQARPVTTPLEATTPPRADVSAVR